MPPPICPKCGSHRTEVVGRSDDAARIVIRCNNCGERSTVPVSDGMTACVGLAAQENAR
jgi:uncharacterized Zn finger protein